MSVRRFSSEQPDSFAFKADVMKKVQWWLDKYPQDRKRSAMIPILWLAQKQNGGWLSEPALRIVAELLDAPYIRVYEVVTFYTMFNMEPVGRYHFQLCGTTPCMLRGANELKAVCEKRIGAKGQVSEDGMFSWVEVECLGACVNAPMIQINDYYYEYLTPASLEKIIDEFAAGKAPEPGSYVMRETSAPISGATTLNNPALFDGSMAKPIKKLPNAPADAAK